MRLNLLPIALALTGLPLWTTACGSDATGADARPSRITVDFLPLLGARAADDFITTFARVDLTIVSGNDQSTQTLPLGESDSTATFNVTLKPGPAAFRVRVFSNNDAELYSGSASTTVGQSDFSVSITPAAVNAVLLIVPRNPTLFPDPDNVIRAQFLLRNAGTQVLQWSVDFDASRGLIGCEVSTDFAGCVDRSLDPSPSPIGVNVIFDPDVPESEWRMTFTSPTVGTASFSPTIP